MHPTVSMDNVGGVFFPPDEPESLLATMTVEEAVRRVAVLMPTGALRNSLRERHFTGKERFTGRVASLVKAVGRAGVSAVMRVNGQEVHLWLGPYGAALGAWMIVYDGRMARHVALCKLASHCRVHLEVTDDVGIFGAEVSGLLGRMASAIRWEKPRSAPELWLRVVEDRARVDAALDQYEKALPSQERLNQVQYIEKLAALED